MEKMKKLTLKQRRFADKYLETLNATQSYLYAYDCQYNTAKAHGYKLLQEPQVQKYIQEEMAKVQKEGVASAKEVLQELTKVMLDDDEKGSVRVRAMELLGKRHLLFTEQINVKTDNNMVIDLGDLVDDDNDEYDE